MPPGKIYDLPKIFCKQTSVPVSLLVPTRVPLHNVHKQYMCDADRNPRLDFMSTNVGGPTAADERHHRGCWLSQGDQENSTVGERGIGGVKVSSHQKYTAHVVHSPVKYVCRHFKSTYILRFIRPFFLLLRSLPLLSPLFYGEMQQ